MNRNNEDFPYKDLIDHPLWSVIDKALDDLIKNKDVLVSTPRKYVIGYLLQSILEAKE